MEQVILVDDQNNPIGVADKETIHTTHTPLHRGFSLFLFNSKNELLLTQRSFSKKTFAGVWTNTVCGHPAPNETATEAARRRLKEELGIAVGEIKEVSPYRYRFADKNGIVENEICPILVTRSDVFPEAKPEEIAAWKWLAWKEFLRQIETLPQNFSPWSVEEGRILRKILRY